MGIGKTEVDIGYELPPLTRRVTEERRNAYEACGIFNRPNIHNDPEVARATGIGASPIGSGSLLTAYLSSLMTRFFGESWAHGGKVELTYIRPVRDGDTITVHAAVKERVPEAGAIRVVFEVWTENQNGDKMAVGWASAVV